MPTTTQYPTPFNASFPAEPAGPQFAVCYQEPPEFKVRKSPMYGDGGVDTSLDNITPTRRWVLEYSTLPATEAQILDDHYASAFGEHYSFSFRDPKTNTLYSGVKYEKFERPAHRKYYIQRRGVVLIKRP